MSRDCPATELLRQPHRLPPIWFLLAVLSQFAGSWTAGTRGSSAIATGLGIGLLIGGITLVLVAARQFQSHQTSILPFQTPSQLMTRGVFRFTRNPIYLGEFIMLLGLAALLGTWRALVPIPIFLLVIQGLFILPEERILVERFGERYRQYRRRTRRW